MNHIESLFSACLQNSFVLFLSPSMADFLRVYLCAHHRNHKGMKYITLQVSAVTRKGLDEAELLRIRTDHMETLDMGGGELNCGHGIIR